MAMVIAATAAILTTAPAASHPHILASVRVELIYGNDGALSALRQLWVYDPAYSAFALRQADDDRDGNVSDKELQAFAVKQVSALAEFHYYTSLKGAGKELAFGEATDSSFSRDDKNTLMLHFTLPIKLPNTNDKGLTIEIFDPQFFAYFTMPEEGSVLLTGAHPACTFKITSPAPIDLKNTRSIPEIFWAALDGSVSAGQKFVNRVDMLCP